MDMGLTIESLRAADKAKPARILLIDDDPVFCRRVESLARKAGFPVEVTDSVENLGSVSRLSEFDVAVLDYFLEGTTGLELAEYMETFFESGVEVILISSRSAAEVKEDAQKAQWPSSIRTFISKEQGVDAILDAVYESLRHKGMSKHLAWQ
jgi:CheY-like chemotaxis protein